MIVGLFNDSYPPLTDGVANVVVNYKAQLEAMGHTCYVIAPHIPGMQRTPGDHLLTFRSHVLPKRREYRWGVGRLDMAFWREARRIPFDVLHCHSPFSTFQVARALAKRLDAPLVSTFHTRYRDDLCQALPDRFVDGFALPVVVRAYQQSDEVWTVNRASADVLHAYGYRGDIRIEENGCDLPMAQPDPEARAWARERFGLSDAPLLLYIGQHIVQKNLPLLLDALLLAKRDGFRYQALFVGDGAYRADMERFVRENGLDDRVRFAGVVRDREAVRRLYLASYALLFPSRYDTSSLVVREAAACLCPTLLTEGATTAEGIIDGENGLLAPDEPAGFAKRLEALLADEALRERVAQGAQATRYRSWSAAVADAAARYQQLIDSRAAAKR